MQFPCRNCGKPVPAENVNVQASIAKCAACNSVFGINAAMFSTPQPGGMFSGGPPQGAMGVSAATSPAWNPSAGGQNLMGGPSYPPQGYYSSGPRPAVPMPSGISVDTDGKDLLIYRSWFSWVFIFLAVFCTIWDSIVLVFIGAGIFAGTQVGPMALLFLLIPGLFLVVGACLTYYTICGFVNTTTIRVGQGEISVAHGPLPWWGNIAYPSGDIAQLFTTEQVHYGKRGSVSFTYSVEFVQRNGARQTLASGLTDAAQALFIEQEIERCLGIQDVPVGGELRRW